MADIRLVKPQANTAQTVSCAADSRFVLEFPSDAALFARDGDDLVLTFEDGSSIRLQDFYTTYSKEEMPSFEMEGAEISGEDFFAALGNPDLMPAAGPTAAAAQGNSSFNVYGDAALLSGIDRLDGLDISFNFGQQTQDDLYASIGRGDDGEDRVDHGVTVRPDEPGSGTPGIPVVPHPGGSDGTIVADRDVLEVSEANLKGGTAFGEKEPKASGSMTVSAPDGVASITIDGTVVYKNGQLTEERVHTDEGYLEVTGYDPSTGKLDYTFLLTEATDKHKIEGGDKAIAHEMTVTVTDSDGDTGSGVIRVEITDDDPVAYNNVNSVTENASIEGNVLTDEDEEGRTDSFGADGGSGVTWDLSGYTEAEGGTEEDSYTQNTDGTYTVYTQYGTAILNPDGTYSFEAKADAGLENNQFGTVSFGYTITDSDGDNASAKLDITISGDSNVPSVEITKPESDEANIMVDEGSLVNGSGQHTEHGAGATGFFNVDLNGEDGTITLAGNGQSIVLNVKDGESFDASSLSSITVNGVEVSISSVQQSKDGTWTVAYEYALNQNQPHKTPASSNYHEDELQGSITVDVVDATGDHAQQGTITVEVHDDGPVLTAVSVDQQVNDNNSVINGSFDGLALGADSDGATITVEVNNNTTFIGNCRKMQH